MFLRTLKILPLALTGVCSLQANLLFSDVVPFGGEGYGNRSARLLPVEGPSFNPSQTQGASSPWEGPTTDTIRVDIQNLDVPGVFGNEGGSFALCFTGAIDRVYRNAQRSISVSIEKDTLWFSAIMWVNQIAYDLSSEGSAEGFVGFLTGPLAPSTCWGEPLFGVGHRLGESGVELGGLAFGFSGGCPTIIYQNAASGAPELIRKDISAGFIPENAMVWVARVKKGSEGKLDVWLLDSLPGKEEELGEPILQVQADVLNDDVRWVSLFLQGASSADVFYPGGKILFDAIRMATSYGALRGS